MEGGLTIQGAPMGLGWWGLGWEGIKKTAITVGLIGVVAEGYRGKGGGGEVLGC